MLSNEVEDLWKVNGYCSTYFLVPKEDGSHRPILSLKFFNLMQDFIQDGDCTPS